MSFPRSTMCAFNPFKEQSHACSQGSYATKIQGANSLPANQMRSLPFSSIPSQRKSLISFSILLQIELGALNKEKQYGAAKGGRHSNYVPAPDGCIPIHLNLVARHGTRAPTKKRIKELNNLEKQLEMLLSAAARNGLSLHKVPSWLKGWKSPWREKVNGGELIPEGEQELYDLGIRTRKLFPDLLSDDYHPDIYTIKATQIPRASASAVAFGMGLFRGRGSLGLDRHRAFSVVSESRASDTMLRFFDCCQRYEDYRKNQEPEVEKRREPVLDDISKSLTERYGLNFTWQHISSLWFLCKQEASLLDITDQACGMFSLSEVALLEWTDDMEVFILKGYGNSLNYRMGVPLLQDIVQSMEKAITAKEGTHTHLKGQCWKLYLLCSIFLLAEKQVPGSYEKARLRFKQIQREQSLQLPPRPPATRIWKGSDVAPFAGNNMLVLYSCPATNLSDEYFVQVLHNEEPIAMPGCDGLNFCPFQMFKDKIVAPHLEHDFDTLCTVNVEEPTPPTPPPEPSKLSLFRWLFSLWNDDKQPRTDEL
ncbi:multiple inositol polyphosphate phosphatase 1-like isoform X1 [Cucumis melo var. makuwa]|uniref:Multiple inositol polyphosphate phosphatase 1 n=1 Tax=Cucumis melo var. makuwa TaxID=1194695 RepID=A0A5D3E4X3_CUCMM|nr:multiple inositol polyphosphate phosphatase 1-like isoform X1 [Cucumis melo var. makuwa]